MTNHFIRKRKNTAVPIRRSAGKTESFRPPLRRGDMGAFGPEKLPFSGMMARILSPFRKSLLKVMKKLPILV
jgi:hypothetical protein